METTMQDVRDFLTGLCKILEPASSGVWEYSKFRKEDGSPIESIQDAADAVAASTLKGDKPELWGVSLQDKDEHGKSLVVCYTGNGPTSEANALAISYISEIREKAQLLLDKINQAV